MLQIEKILGRIDDDRDGSIRVEDVLKVSSLTLNYYGYEKI